MSTKTKNNTKAQLKMIKAARGLERKAHFENGGSLADWRGGVHTVTRNKKKYTRKSKHRARGY
jgi:hypothetical protein